MVDVSYFAETIAFWATGQEVEMILEPSTMTYAASLPGLYSSSNLSREPSHPRPVFPSFAAGA
jgi:hypothetical protein